MQSMPSRRHLLLASSTVAAVAGMGWCPSVLAMPVRNSLDSLDSFTSEWWPYRADAAVRLDPTLTQRSADGVPSGYVKRMPQALHGKQDHLPQASVMRSALLPPKAYDLTGQRWNIDPWVLYGVALQESQMKFGETTLPYPWTLCVAGAARRYGSYAATLQALRRYVNERGIRNVDCGAMQVNWRWHSDKLQSFERALDPYPNLAVGAQILRAHFEREGSWMRAAALYHTGSDKDAATVARGQRYSSGVFRRLARMGLDTPSLLASTGWRRYAV